jgi:tripartite ATP-independent transporter DctM subunit
MGPPIPAEERKSFRELLKLLTPIIPAGILIFLVLGTIIVGIAAPTEAAGIGCLGAFLIAIFKKRMNFKGLVISAEVSIKATAMVMWTLFGANIFIALYIMVGGQAFVQETLMGTGLSPMGIIWIMMIILIFLGMFIDWVGIIMLAVPLFGPIIRQLGFDPIWFGVVFGMNMQMAFLTPPFGFSLFYLKSVAPPEVSTMDVWKSAVPFLALQFLGMVVCMYFPEIILFIPRVFFRG